MKASPLLWDPEYQVWSRVSENSLLTYAHLLLALEKHQDQNGVIVDVASMVKKKTYGTGASKNGFQITSYVAAINKLITEGVCLCLFIIIYLFSFIFSTFCIEQ